MSDQKTPAYRRAYRAKNCDKIRAQARARYAEQRAHILALARAWRQKHPDAVRATRIRYAAAHPRTPALPKIKRDPGDVRISRHLSYLRNRDKKLEYARKYRETHRTEIAARNRGRVRNGEKERQYARQYRATHREQIRLKRQRYRQRHPEIMRARRRRYRLAHRQQMNERKRRQRRKDPERTRSIKRKARERRRTLRPEQYREYKRRARQRYRKRHPEQIKKQKRTERKHLTDGYLSRLLGGRKSLYSPDLLGAKRVQVLLSRKLRGRALAT